MEIKRKTTLQEQLPAIPLGHDNGSYSIKTVTAFNWKSFVTFASRHKSNTMY